MALRTIYRVIEFMDGWDGTIISTEWIFGRWSPMVAPRLESYSNN